MQNSASLEVVSSQVVRSVGSGKCTENTSSRGVYLCRCYSERSSRIRASDIPELTACRFCSYVIANIINTALHSNNMPWARTTAVPPMGILLPNHCSYTTGDITTKSLQFYYWGYHYQITAVLLLGISLPNHCSSTTGDITTKSLQFYYWGYHYQITTIYPDADSEKAIMGSVVYCIHHKEGCKWTDELRKLKVSAILGVTPAVLTDR
uniref:Uncharacterized protein n=1 Tax=Timema douglasi TaxID=61478 RepID=A0A7R8ZAH3_TIMDO|nr:unnamed protein product [Timema douglasi]